VISFLAWFIIGTARSFHSNEFFAASTERVIRGLRRKHDRVGRENLLGSYVADGLSPGEEIKYSASVSLWRYWLSFLIGAAVLFGALWGFAQGLNSGQAMRLVLIILVVLALVLIFWPFLVRKSTELVVTDKRLIVKHGLVSTHSIEIRFEKIETVRVNQGLLGKIFKYGDIMVTGTGTTFDPIPAISHPLEFRSALNQAMESGGKEPL